MDYARSCRVGGQVVGGNGTVGRRGGLECDDLITITLH